jgi:low temperature requirement protein LtrA
LTGWSCEHSLRLHGSATDERCWPWSSSARCDDPAGSWEAFVPTSEDDRATTFELFFDLVYVFAATQVTGYMAHGHDGQGVVQGLLLLALLWWTWSAYAWLGNQARADEGVLRAGMAVAMAAIFVVALTIPEAWQDAPGGLDGPLVLVGAYLLVRCVHLTLYAVAATGDRELRRQLTITWGPLLASAALLIPGALAGGWTQTLLFAGALLVDWVGTYLTSRQGGWRMHSAGHWTERHGDFVILAIGESVVAIGRARPSTPSARRCCWRPSWAWPPPSACGGCTSTRRRWRPSTG